MVALSEPASKERISPGAKPLFWGRRGATPFGGPAVYGIMNTNPDTYSPHPEGYAKLWELINDIKIAMFTTVADDGVLHSRPMVTQQADSGEAVLWFFTSIDSPKVADIYHQRQVGVAYASAKKHKYVSVAGRAYVVRDSLKIRELWKPEMALWFPEGLDDLYLALLRVEVDSAQFWDSPSGAMVRLVNLAKRKLTGKPSVDEGGSQSVQVR
jgi:general stress protein 26